MNAVKYYIFLFFWAVFLLNDLAHFFIEFFNEFKHNLII